MEPTVIFEDDELLVINKPAGMIVNRADTTKDVKTVQEWIQEYGIQKGFWTSQNDVILGSEAPPESDFYNRAGIVHRLDKETSGLLIVAKTPTAFENLQGQFKERIVKKKYIALAHGEVKPSEGEINVTVGRLPWNRKRFGVVPGGRESFTNYKVLGIKYSVSGSKKEPLTLLELSPLTGRTHQIRVHLKYLGFPIVSDELYAGRKQARGDRKWCERLFLHAAEIVFQHPKSGEMVTFESKLPDDLQNVIAKLSS